MNHPTNLHVDGGALAHFAAHVSPQAASFAAAGLAVVATAIITTGIMQRHLAGLAHSAAYATGWADGRRRREPDRRHLRLIAGRQD